MIKIALQYNFRGFFFCPFNFGFAKPHTWNKNDNNKNRAIRKATKSIYVCIVYASHSLERCGKRGTFPNMLGLVRNEKRPSIDICQIAGTISYYVHAYRGLSTFSSTVRQ